MGNLSQRCFCVSDIVSEKLLFPPHNMFTCSLCMPRTQLHHWRSYMKTDVKNNVQCARLPACHMSDLPVHEQWGREHAQSASGQASSLSVSCTLHNKWFMTRARIVGIFSIVILCVIPRRHRDIVAEFHCLFAGSALSCSSSDVARKLTTTISLFVLLHGGCSLVMAGHSQSAQPQVILCTHV